VERDYRWLGQAMVKHYHGDDADLGLLMAAMQTAFGGMAVEDFSQEVARGCRQRRTPCCGGRTWRARTCR
jgi:hypothetical protein